MNDETKVPVPIAVPEEAGGMSPKQMILLMRNLGVGKENYAEPHHARAWTTSEFVAACARDDVMNRVQKDPPERTTVDAWFHASGPLPDDRRDAWLFFFHVFFSYDRRAFGTLEWKTAYFDALRRAKIAAVGQPGMQDTDLLPLEDTLERPFIDILPLLRGKNNE